MPYAIDTTSYRSPNHDPRPVPVRALVLHSGEGSKASDLYTLCSARPPMNQRVSAHYYVDRAANIYQLVDDSRRAWHAGTSSYLGLTNWNDFAIGIETEHQLGQMWPDAQRAALAWLCRQLVVKYQIEQRMVVAHRWIAQPAGRKADPTNWPDTMLHIWISGLYVTPPPAPPAKVYRVRGLPVYQRPDLTGTLAGHLDSGTQVAIDKTYPNGAGHLETGLGFVDLDGLEG